MFVTVHLLLKENTNLGKMFVESCIRSLEDFPDQLVILDNGSSEEVMETVKSLLKTVSYEYVIEKSDMKKFCDLRNRTLELTNPKTDLCVMVDSDEVFWEGSLKKAKPGLEELKDKYSWGRFHHLVNTPCHTQGPLKRSFIYPYSKSCRWVGNVHETIEGWDKDNEVENHIEWIHMGYLRSVIATALKWIHYTVLEHGNADRYLFPKEQPDSKVDFLMTQNGIDQILCDRKEHCVIFKEPYSVYMAPMLQRFERSGFDNWQDWVTYEVDPVYGELLKGFKVMAEASSWSEVVNFIVQERLWEDTK